MKYLESKKIVHRNLAARNIFLLETPMEGIVAKVSDFGLARKIQRDSGYYLTEHTAMRNPIRWSAPEVLSDEKNEKILPKADVWSFGVTLYEIFTLGKDPYPTLKDNAVKSQVLGSGKSKALEGEVKKQFQVSGVPNGIQGIIDVCLSFQPGERPSFDQIEAEMLKIQRNVQ